MLVGVQEEYYLAASTTEPMAIVKNIKPGQTVQIVVQAVNGNLQGVASEPILFTVLLPMRRTSDAKVAETLPVEEVGELAKPTNGDRMAIHRNGNGKSHRALLAQES